jgi:hypothetical protein
LKERREKRRERRKGGRKDMHVGTWTEKKE